MAQTIFKILYWKRKLIQKSKTNLKNNELENYMKENKDK